MSWAYFLPLLFCSWDFVHSLSLYFSGICVFTYVHRCRGGCEGLVHSGAWSEPIGFGDGEIVVLPLMSGEDGVQGMVWLEGVGCYVI